MRRIAAFIFLGGSLCLNGSLCIAAITKVYPGSGSLQRAIQSAKPGDTLILQSGVYKEHDLVIQKKITITGIGFPVIDAENKFQLFLVYKDSVTIQGLEIRNI